MTLLTNKTEVSAVNDTPRLHVGRLLRGKWVWEARTGRGLRWVLRGSVTAVRHVVHDGPRFKLWTPARVKFLKSHGLFFPFKKLSLFLKLKAIDSVNKAGVQKLLLNSTPATWNSLMKDLLLWAAPDTRPDSSRQVQMLL